MISCVNEGVRLTPIMFTLRYNYMWLFQMHKLTVIFTVVLMLWLENVLDHLAVDIHMHLCSQIQSTIVSARLVYYFLPGI